MDDAPIVTEGSIVAEAPIVAEGLTKVFRTVVREPGARGALRALVAPRHAAKTAVDDVSLTVNPGELLALLGPNGAGKSTTIKMLTGILTPTSGTVRVNGIVPYEDRIANARKIGAVFGQRSQLWLDLPAKYSLEILRDIHGLTDDAYRRTLREFDKILNLTEFWDTRARQLSLGQRVRCDLAAALIHDPPVVFLDEPTIGMDVVVKEQVREFLRDQVTRRGRTVLLTTHDMTEVSRLAERVALIDHGRLVYDGAIGGLRHLANLTWHVHAEVEVPSVTYSEIPGLRLVRSDEGGHLTYAPDGTASSDNTGPISPAEAVRRVIDRLPVTGVRVEEPDLEDIVRVLFS
jgi:ABC-2 type transport system ATP-binding protein